MNRSRSGSRSSEAMDGVAAEPVCYICYGDGRDEQLISPCAGCRGSSGFVHFTCLKDFIRQRGDWTNLKCPTCKHKYEGEAAVKLAEEGLRLAEGRGKETRAYVGALAFLINVYLNNHNFSKVYELVLVALSLAERVFGLGEEYVLIWFQKVMLSHYHEVGEVAKAHELARQNLELTERAYGEDHEQVAKTLRYIYEYEDFSRGRAMLERALVILKRVHGNDHEDLSSVLSDLGCSWLGVKDFAHVCSSSKLKRFLSNLSLFLFFLTV